MLYETDPETTPPPLPRKASRARYCVGENEQAIISLSRVKPK